MGAWGYKAFDSDAACDFMFDIEKVLKKVANKKFNNDDYEEIRATAEIIINLSKSYRFNEELVEPVLEKLKLILNDKEWMNSWDKPIAAQKEVKKQLSNLKKVFNKLTI